MAGKVTGTRVAIVGMGGVFPGASTPGGLWEVVRDGRCVAREVPPGRWGIDPRSALARTPGEVDRVSSLRVANARIAYSARGALAEANTPGWLTRFFNSPLMPF